MVGLKGVEIYLEKLKQLPASSMTISPVDSRYFDKEVARYLSNHSRTLYQAYVEAQLVNMFADSAFKVCSSATAKEIEQACQSVTLAEVIKEEDETKHDLKALVNIIRTKVSPEARRFVHMGATSSDVVDTAVSLQYQHVTQNVLTPYLHNLTKTLIKLAVKHAKTVQVGRTHGQHGVPITFGWAMAGYVERLGTSSENLKVYSSELVGQYSGAMGSYNAQTLFLKNPRAFEAKFLNHLGLQQLSSTQITPPEPLTRLLSEMVQAAAITADLANDMRQLQRTEIAEVNEGFASGQIGSSTMAQKRNPISFENIVSLNKVVKGLYSIVLDNQTSEHQRDLTGSAASRFYPELVAVTAKMMKTLDGAMSNLQVDTKRMKTNLGISGGAIAAEPLYLVLNQLGHPDGHAKINELTSQAQKAGIDFFDALENDKQIMSNYWPKTTKAQQAIIRQPQKHYIGLAAEQAKTIAAKWSKKLS